MDKRFKLWSLLETVPTARMTLHGIEPEPLLEISRDLLAHLEYHDAKVQWTDVLAQRHSPWWAHIFNRGKVGGKWYNQVLDIVEFPSELVPGLREHMGKQTVLLAAQRIGPHVTDCVLSVEQHAGGITQRVFASEILESLTLILEPRGVRFENLHAVKAKDLEKSCPAHHITRILLNKEAKKDARKRKRKNRTTRR